MKNIIETIKWMGWPLAVILLSIILMQTKCSHKQTIKTQHDTVIIAGDKQIIK